MRLPSPSPTTVIRVGEKDLPLVIRRDRRARRMILRLDHRGEVATVTMPPLIPASEAIALATRSSSWLASRLAALPARVPFAIDAVVPLLGHPHRIIADGNTSRITAGAGAIRVGNACDCVETRLLRWFKQRARQEIGARAADKAARIDGEIGRISIRDPKSRWGSCSGAGTLSFSWRLVMAPADVLDYVVAHEVAHLAVKGHGPEFWAMANGLTGNLDTARAWLRREGNGLHRYG